MKRLPTLKFGWYGIALSVCALAVLIQSATIYRTHRDGRRSQRQVQRLRKELRDLMKVSPGLSADNAAQLAVELSALRAASNEIKTRLAGGGDQVRPEVSTPVRQERADGYFEIASFVERMRDTARISGVALASDERFGFDAFAHAGPGVAERPTVMRQRVAVEHVLRALFSAQPEQLNAVGREPAPVQSGSVAESRSGATGSSAELIVPDSRFTVRRQGIVDACAFRVSFTGQTVSLRLLLNELANGEFPLAVTSVDVESATVASKTRDSRLSETDVDPPLVARSSSNFTVTIEAFELVVPPVSSKG